MKKIVILLALLVADCATKPMPCEVKINGKCREMTVSEKNGAVTRGHGEYIKEIK